MASLFDRLKKKVTDNPLTRGTSRAIDQVNIFDNGRSWQTRTPATNQSVAQQAGNIGKGIVAKPVGLVNSGIAAGAGLGGLGRIGYESVFGNDQSYQNAIRNTHQVMDAFTRQGGGLLGVGTGTNINDWSRVGARQLAGNTINTGVQTSMLAAPELRILRNPLLNRLLNNGVQSAVGSTISQGVESGRVNPWQVVKDTGTGVALGEVGPLTKGVVRRTPYVMDAAAGNVRPKWGITDDEFRAAQRVRQDQRGWGHAANVQPGDRAKYYQVARKLKVDPDRSVKEIDDALGAFQTYQVRKGKPGGFAMITNDKGQMIRGIGGKAEAEVPPPPPNIRQGGFVTSVKHSPEVSAPVRKMTNSDYVVRSTKQLAAEADDFAKGSVNKARDAINDRLAVPLGHIDDKTVAAAIATAKRLDGAGQHDASSLIYEGLDEHLRAKGQGVQAASLLSNRTPEGLKFKAERDLRKAGVKVTPEDRLKMQGALDEVRKAAPGEPHEMAVRKYQKLVGDMMPSSASDKLTSIWKAGLLTGVKTQTGNILSNSTFAALHDVSAPGAALIDKLISLGTGKRTKTLTYRGRATGAAEGVKRGRDFLRSGIDERAGLTNKFEGSEVNFKNPVAKAYVNGVFRLMGAADRPHYYSQLRNSLYDLATAEGKTQGLHGKALTEHVNKAISDPPMQMLQTASDEAHKAVLGYDTMLSKGVGRLRQAADTAESPLGRGLAKGALNVAMPFTKVPSAFLSRVVDFTPVGAVKEAAVQISKGTFDQRALATAISEAGTGTAIAYLGMKLADSGQLSGAYPTDSKEQQRWKAEGIQPNSVKLGGKWLSMNYLGPIGMLFNAGARASESKAEGSGIAGQVAQAGAGVPKDLLGQSFLQGTNQLINATQDPGRYLGNLTEGYAGSTVPTLSGDVANAIDKYQRNVNNPLEAIQAKIPGLRQGLQRKNDVYGNDLERKSTPLDTMANPFRPSNQLNSPTLDEVRRLHNADPQNKDLQVTPTALPKTLTIDGVRTTLNDKQRYDLQKQVGQSTQTLWGQLIQTPQYQALDDLGKARALTNLRQDAQALAIRQYSAQNQLGQYSADYSGKQTDASKNLQALGDGLDTERYIKSPKPAATPKPKTTKAKTTSARRTSTRTAKARKFTAPLTNPYSKLGNISTVHRLLRNTSVKAKRPVRRKLA